MITFSYYDPATGLFTGGIFSGTLEALAVNIPQGLRAIQGRFDRHSQRVDTAKAQVVDFQPPQPSPDHEWRADEPLAPTRAQQRWKWRLKADVAQRAAQAIALQKQLEAVEARQIRPLIELMLDPNAVDAMGQPVADRLAALEREKAALRASLSAPIPTPEVKVE